MPPTDDIKQNRIQLIHRPKHYSRCCCCHRSRHRALFAIYICRILPHTQITVNKYVVELHPFNSVWQCTHIHSLARFAPPYLAFFSCSFNEGSTIEWIFFANLILLSFVRKLACLLFEHIKHVWCCRIPSIFLNSSCWIRHWHRTQYWISK